MESIRAVTFAGMMAILLFSTQTVRAQDPKEVFKQAHEAYAQGQFSQAVTLYESARTQGLNAWELHYDLGNAYYKAGAVGKAVASYFRAFKLKSNQRDVVYNLNLALTRVGDPLIPNEALAALFWRAFYGLSIDTLAIAACLLFIVTCLGGFLFFAGKRRWGGEPALAVIAILIVSGAWLGLRIWIAEKPQAVVVSGIAEVRSGPNLSYPANFTIPEGRRVLILEEQEPIKGWIEIGVPKEGLKGWVPDTSVEPI